MSGLHFFRRRLHDNASYEYSDFSIRFHPRGAGLQRLHVHEVVLSAEVNFVLIDVEVGNISCEYEG